MAKLEETFREFLSKYGNSKLAIATHNRADADAIASAYAMNKILPESVICISEDMGEGAKMLSEKLGIGARDLSSLKKADFDGLVVVDTSTYTLVPEAKGWKILCIVDHHRAEGRDMKGEFELIEPEAPSTAEILSLIHISEPTRPY